MNNLRAPSGYVRSNDVKFIFYERLPTPIQGALRNSFWVSLVTNIAFVGFYLLLPPENLPYVRSGDFFIWAATANWVNAVFNFYDFIAEPLLIANGIGFGLNLLVLLISQGLNRPVSEPMHWTVALNSLPAGLSLIVGMISIGIVGTIFIINLVTLIVIAVVKVAVICMIFVGLLNS